MRGQRSAFARLGPRERCRRLLLRRCLPVRARNVAFFERELQLVGVEPLRMPAELCSLELPDELAHPLDAAEQFVALGDQRQRCRPQARHVPGKRVGHRHCSPGSTLFRLVRRIPSAALNSAAVLIASPAAARSAVRAPASSRAPRPRLPAAPATGA